MVSFYYGYTCSNRGTTDESSTYLPNLPIGSIIIPFPENFSYFDMIVNFFLFFNLHFSHVYWGVIVREMFTINLKNHINMCLSPPSCFRLCFFNATRLTSRCALLLFRWVYVENASTNLMKIWFYMCSFILYRNTYILNLWWN